MSVYVDDMRAVRRGMIADSYECHMIADTSIELLGMARSLGRSHLDIHKLHTPWEHLDLTSEDRDRAVQLGAIEITQRELVEMIQARKPVRRRRGEGKIIDVEHLNAIEA